MSNFVSLKVCACSLLFSRSRPVSLFSCTQSVTPCVSSHLYVCTYICAVVASVAESSCAYRLARGEVHRCVSVPAQGRRGDGGRAEGEGRGVISVAETAPPQSRPLSPSPPPLLSPTRADRSTFERHHPRCRRPTSRRTKQNERLATASPAVARTRTVI